MLAQLLVICFTTYFDCYEDFRINGQDCGCGFNAFSCGSGSLNSQLSESGFAKLVLNLAHCKASLKHFSLENRRENLEPAPGSNRSEGRTDSFGSKYHADFFAPKVRSESLSAKPSETAAGFGSAFDLTGSGAEKTRSDRSVI